MSTRGSITSAATSRSRSSEIAASRGGATGRTEIAHGGERKGAGRKAKPPDQPIARRGRPPKPRTPEELNQSFDAKATAKLPELFDTVFQIAQGVKIAAYTKPRKERSVEMLDEDDQPIYVYSVPPDKAAVFYLVDRAAGKSAVKPVEIAETELILEIGSMGGAIDEREQSEGDEEPD